MGAGSDRFKQQIEKKTGKKATPLPRGGDRKSEKYRVDVHYQYQ